MAFRHVGPMLQAAGHIAHILGEPDVPATGTEDVVWLPIVGERKWILVTKDKSIRKRGIELHALNEARVRTFVLTAADLRGDEQAQVLREALPAMLRLLRRRSAHFIARVTASSNVEIIQFHKYIKYES